MEECTVNDLPGPSPRQRKNHCRAGKESAIPVAHSPSASELDIRLTDRSDPHCPADRNGMTTGIQHCLHRTRSCPRTPTRIRRQLSAPRTTHPISGEALSTLVEAAEPANRDRFHLQNSNSPAPQHGGARCFRGIVESRPGVSTIHPATAPNAARRQVLQLERHASSTTSGSDKSDLLRPLRLNKCFGQVLPHNPTTHTLISEFRESCAPVLPFPQQERASNKKRAPLFATRALSFPAVRARTIHGYPDGAVGPPSVSRTRSWTVRFALPRR